MNTWSRYILIGFLIVLLFLVRAVAQEYFYDPLIHFFKQDYLNGTLPDSNDGKLYFYLSLRYWINSLISIGVIYLLFPSKNNLWFTFKVYLFTFFILGIGFLVFYNTSSPGNFRALFYTRRFLIHPVLLLLLIPAFYRKRLLKARPKENN